MLSVIVGKVISLIQQVFPIIQQFILYSHQVREELVVEVLQWVAWLGTCTATTLYTPHINKNTPDTYVLHHSIIFLRRQSDFPPGSPSFWVQSISSFIIWYLLLKGHFLALFEIFWVGSTQYALLKVTSMC
jgi:hypothetical protein